MSERTKRTDDEEGENPHSEEVTRSWHAEVLFGQLSNVELGDHEGGDEGDVLVDVHGLRRAHGVGANAYADGDRDSIVWAEGGSSRLYLCEILNGGWFRMVLCLTLWATQRKLKAKIRKSST